MARIIRSQKPKSQPNESSIHCFNLPERTMDLVKDMTTNIHWTGEEIKEKGAE